MNLSWIRPALFAAACLAGVAQAQTVTPPPLPPGSNLVRPEPGMNEDERKRYVRAHHHKFHHKKDYTRDDSVLGHESEAAVRVNAGQPGAGTGMGASGSASGAGVGGAGTGPAREKTDKGASSYFFGNDKK
jgi:hypothetical protein